MPFTALKLKAASGANQIKSADDAYSFMMHMRLSYRNEPRWHGEARGQPCLHKPAACLEPADIGWRLARRLCRWGTSHSRFQQPSSAIFADGLAPSASWAAVG